MTIRLIEGRPVQVVHERTPLPPRLDALLDALRVVVRRQVVVAGGARPACAQGEHRFRPWLSGVLGRLELVLNVCADCETVEVRDVSFDRLPGVPVGASPLLRRDRLLGWYTGKRPNGRIYR